MESKHITDCNKNLKTEGHTYERR